MFKDLMQKLTDRRDGLEASAEDGFTLIELMVVLLIMGILLAFAIPTFFLWSAGWANDRAAQSNLNTVLTSGKSIYKQNSQTYPVTATLLTDIATDEPSLTLNTAASTTALSAGQMSAVVSTGGNGAVYYALAKKTGLCWWIADNTTAITDGTTLAIPYSTTATTGATSAYTGGTGVPTLAGTWYGVFKGGTSGCNATGTGGIGSVLYNTNTGTTVTGSTGNISSTGFPSSS